MRLCDMSHCLSFSGLLEWFQVLRSNVNHLLKVYRRAPTAETPLCVNIICFPSPCLSVGCRVPCAAGSAAVCDHWSWLWLIWLPEHSFTTHDKKWGRGGCLFGPESCKHQRRYSNLTFLCSAVTAFCLQGSFSLPPCQPSPPLPHILANMGGCLWSLLETVTRATPPCVSVTCRLFLQPPVCVPE